MKIPYKKKQLNINLIFGIVWLINGIIQTYFDEKFTPIRLQEEDRRYFKISITEYLKYNNLYDSNPHKKISQKKL